MLVVQVDTVAIYGSRASEATKKPKGSYCQAWPTPRQVSSHLGEQRQRNIPVGWEPCMLLELA